ncbi:MAG: hypothetical protein ACLFUL_00530 [Desulfobacteraceae bacterium]
MANILRFSRNRCTSVEQVDEDTLRSTCRLQDTLTDATVEIAVKLPDLEITHAAFDIRRTHEEGCRGPSDPLQNVVGVRIGPGVLKIIKGLVGKAVDCRQLGFMVEECCHGVILSFTKEEMVSSPRPTEMEALKAYYASKVKENIRLYNRCAAFAAGSSLVEGIEPPESS